MKAWKIVCTGWKTQTSHVVPAPEGINIADYFSSMTPIWTYSLEMAERMWLERYKGPDCDGIEPVWTVEEMEGE